MVLTARTVFPVSLSLLITLGSGFGVSAQEVPIDRTVLPIRQPTIRLSPSSMRATSNRRRSFRSRRPPARPMC